MFFDALVLGYARRAPLQAFVVVVAIALGVGASLAVVLANASAVSAFAANANVTDAGVTLQALGGDDGLDERLLPRIARLRGIKEARPIVEDTLVLGSPQRDPRERELLRIEGVDTFQPFPRDAETREPLPGPFDRTGGGALPETFVDDRGITISARLAATYRLRPGTTFVAYAGARPVRFLVANVLPSSVTGVDSSTVFADLATVQPAFGKIGRLDRIDCVVDALDVARVRARLAALAPGLTIVAPAQRSERVRRLASALALDGATLSFVALLAGGALVFNAVSLSVAARRADVGTLRALGASRLAIFATFLCEGAAFGALGSIFGLALGVAGARVATGSVARDLGAPACIAFAAGLGCATLSAFWPAVTAARLRPAFAMQTRGFEGGRSSGRMARILAAAFARLPVPARLAVMHAAAFPARTGVAVASLALGLALLASVDVATQTYRSAANAWANATLAGDLSVRAARASGVGSGARFTPAAVARLRALAGVGAVVAARDDGAGRALTVYARPGSDLVALRTRVVRALAPLALDVQTTRELRARAVTAFDRAFALGYALGLTALAVAVVGVTVTLTALVLERRAEIGILRFLGMTRRGVRTTVLCEAALLGALGAAAGIPLGVALAAVLAGTIDRSAFGTDVSIAVPFADLAFEAALVVVATLLGALGPARIAARIRADPGSRGA